MLTEAPRKASIPIVHFFCPGCWIEVKEDTRRCDACGYDLSTYQGLPLEEKLLLALRHPVRANQRLAVYLLGRLRSWPAVAAFEDLLASSHDPYLLREVAEALARIGDPRSRTLLEAASRHPSVIVSASARALTTRSDS